MSDANGLAVFVHPPSVTASQASDLLSTTASCPSLSPSPSPAPQSVASETESFCDPRNLLVGAKPSVPLINQLDIPTLPAFIPSTDDLLLGLQPTPAQKTEDNSTVNIDALAPIFDTVSASFDSFDEFESDHEIINDFVTQESHAVFLGAKRQRVNSIPFSEEDFSESSFDEELVAMSYAPTMNQPEPQAKRPRSSKKAKVEIDLDFTSHYANSHPESNTPVVSASTADDKDDEDDASNMASPDASTPTTTNRRGRKQSLTDDPSKTFVRTLCSRRFRRQEHLKRHYRSLHTQDKPFECTDCGKKFSRSDNLAQHARTHGNTTTIVGLNLPDSHPIDDKTAMMGATLFDAAAAVGSSSSGSDDESSMKKRKREE